MKRREFITMLAGGAAAAWPLAVRAQQPGRVRRIGVLMALNENDPQSQGRVTAFQQGLENLGWKVGRNLAIDYRWGVSGDERAPAAAAELLRLAPDLILANGVSAVRAAQQATRTVPIVFTGASEPVALGLVASLARPGGNTTGFTNLEPSVGGKWVELLKEIAPSVTRVALIFNPASPSPAQFMLPAQAAGARLGLQAGEVRVHDAAEIETVLAGLGGEPGVGLVFLPDTFTGFHRQLIVELAARYRLPAIYPFGFFAAAGGLLSYGPDVTDQFRRSVTYVDRILRGETPGDLPVQQPTKFELIINLKTAKTLGIDLPPMLLARADEVIE
jgi:putative tryptophan/tyrosine transport system substrate-binding protein